MLTSAYYQTCTLWRFLAAAAGPFLFPLPPPPSRTLLPHLCSLMVMQGQTALHWAARRGYASVVAELLRHGANVHALEYEVSTSPSDAPPPPSPRRVHPDCLCTPVQFITLPPLPPTLLSIFTKALQNSPITPSPPHLTPPSSQNTA